MFRKQISLQIPDEMRDVYDLVCEKCSDRSISVFICKILQAYLNDETVAGAIDGYEEGSEDDSAFIQSVQMINQSIMAQQMALQQAKAQLADGVVNIQDIMNDVETPTTPTEAEPQTQSQAQPTLGIQTTSSHYVTVEELNSILDEKLGKLLDSMQGSGDKTVETAVISAMSDDLFADETETTKIETGTTSVETKVEPPVEEEQTVTQPPIEEVEEDNQESAVDSINDLLGSLNF